ncbi:MAG: hypothetical protein D6767_03845, partial [Candidatus Hydrogenedentota bacterium]
MSSRRNPQREAERLLSGFTLKKNYLAIVLGIGSPFFLELLQRQQRDHGGHILLVEADPILLEKMDVEVPVITPSENQLDLLLSEIDFRKFQGYRIFTIPSSFKLNPDFYSNAVSHIKKALSAKLSDLFTRMEFEP